MFIPQQEGEIVNVYSNDKIEEIFGFINDKIASAIENCDLANVEPIFDKKENSIVGIGDVHGGLEELLVILKRANLIDDQGNWNGGNNKLVMHGDYLDRGKYTASIYFYLRNLQDQAAKSDEKVVLIIGNHELLMVESCYSYYMSNGVSSDEAKEIPAEFLQYILKKDIQKDKLNAVFFSEDKNVIFIHGDCEKLLKEIFIHQYLESVHSPTLNPYDINFAARISCEVELRLMSRFFDYDKSYPRNETRPKLVESYNPYAHNTITTTPPLVNKISNEEIKLFMSNNGLTNKDFEEWLNNKLKEYSQNQENIELAQIMQLATWSRRNYYKTYEKRTKAKPTSKDFISVGHTPTESGKIERHGKRIFNDTAISCRHRSHPSGRMSFTLYDDNKIISHNSNPITIDNKDLSPSKIAWENSEKLFPRLNFL
jgi:hypothetical protein